MKKFKMISTAAAVLALSATIAVAAPHEGGKGKRHGKRGGHGFASERFAAKLNLTEAQKGQLKSLHQSFRDQNRTFLESAKATREQYRDAKKANDTARVQALQPAVDANRERMKQLHEGQRQQFLSILTAEQRAQLDAMKAQGKERRGNRGERGNRGDRGTRAPRGNASSTR